MTVALCLGPAVRSGWAQAPPIDEPERSIARIAASTERPTEGSVLLEDAPDGAAPTPLLHGVLGRIDGLCAGPRDACGLPPKDGARLATARRHFAAALAQLNETAPPMDKVIAEIRAGVFELKHIEKHAPAVEDIARQATAAARRLAARLVDAAIAGGGDRAVLDRASAALARGDLAIDRGNFVVAVFFYGQALGFAAEVPLVFDIDLFEQNIQGLLAGQTIGHAYAIVLNGVLHSSAADGVARTATDAPETPQSTTKEMYIASMTKTLSAVALLKTMHDHGISVEESIASYLPSDWVQGPNLDQVTFRRLLTHRSGLDAAGVSCCSAEGQSFDSLRAIIQAGSTGATDNQPSVYTNANFSLLRILIPQIAIGEAVIAQYANVYPLEAVYAGLYSSYIVDNVLAPAGIGTTLCAPDEPPDARTLLYLLSAPDDPGLDPGDWSLLSGATGWYLSTIEVARFVAFLRFTENILATETRHLMDELFLGWLDPVAFAAYVSGTFGNYRAHGGDYPAGNVRGVTGCMMNFHINVQASLLINSRGGDLGGHACALLRDAFDAAWVAP